MWRRADYADVVAARTLPQKPRREDGLFALHGLSPRRIPAFPEGQHPTPFVIRMRSNS